MTQHDSVTNCIQSVQIPDSIGRMLSLTQRWMDLRSSSPLHQDEANFPHLQAAAIGGFPLTSPKGTLIASLFTISWPPQLLLSNHLPPLPEPYMLELLWVEF